MPPDGRHFLKVKVRMITYLLFFDVIIFHPLPDGYVCRPFLTLIYDAIYRKSFTLTKAVTTINHIFYSEYSFISSNVSFNNFICPNFALVFSKRRSRFFIYFRHRSTVISNNRLSLQYCIITFLSFL